MDAFASIINAVTYFAKTLGTLIVSAIVIGLLLVISLFTPLYSQAVLLILDQVPLSNTSSLSQPPTAIVVLGGGLTNNTQNDIIINDYTKRRLQTAEELYTQFNLPIIVSGKESPWMMKWLQQQNVWWVVPEKNSFNTCENAKFTAQTIHVNNVILVTDAYHMNRARRQFALNGIATLPKIAPLNQSVEWNHVAQNLMHSRRATYELLAFARDIFYPQPDCHPRAMKLGFSVH